MSEAAKNNDSLRWWEWISLPSLMTALIYVMGWSYAYAYYAAFNLGLLSIDIPGQYFIIYGFWVLRDNWWLFLIYFVIAGAWWGVRRCRWFRNDLAVALVPLLILALFIGAYQLARHSAVQRFQAQQQEDYSAYPQVKIWLKDATNLTPDLQSVAEQPAQGLLSPAAAKRWAGVVVLYLQGQAHPATGGVACAVGRGAGVAGVAAVWELFMKFVGEPEKGLEIPSNFIAEHRCKMIPIRAQHNLWSV